MLTEDIRRKHSPGEGLGLIRDRVAQRPNSVLPAGTVVVSSDNHFPLNEDIWYDRFPEHLKDAAPRIWWDAEAGIYQLGANFKPMFPPSAYDLIRSMEELPGCKSLDARMHDLDAEGVHKEIVYPQVLPIFFHYPDFEIRALLFDIYNEYIADLQKKQPDRFFPVAIPAFWDPELAAASVRKIASLGLKTFLLPMNPGKKPDGKNVVYNSAEYDVLWAAIEETGLPISFHIGEKFDYEGINGEGPRLMNDIGPSLFRKNFGQFVFGLIFDKFPGLKVVFSEAGINWVPGAIQDAEMIYNSHGLMFESLPKHRPSWYWHNHCYATFMSDYAGLKLLDIIGADRVMWSVDYPHNEGTFGYTQDVVRDILDVASPDEAKLILGGTANEVYRLG
ncbi:MULTISPECIES: amidohydrolase family protein [Sphingobium]|uniref:amidohydrolase family protein n=1 Tax=Sphingobium sp. MI1205 TaxID=407020 RepID=UPI00077010C0|nr:amidohydrolase family protein [Sphingobium sp. MI1205]AMK19573.1 amidohydrolase 2 [Sphingobium sp. MI1205]